VNRRLLAIDLGDRRTGVAVGDEDSGAAMPLEVLQIPRGDALQRALLALIDAHEPDAVIVGLPLNMDDTEGPRAKDARAFAADLARDCGRTVHLHDERLTSFEAEDRMRGTSRREKKTRSDAVAACVLLESYFAAR
jgi:putative Holliday junction resolvase